MYESEIVVFVFSILLALLGMGIHARGLLHPLYFRGNPAPGIVRLGIVLSLVWILYVLLNHADESVTGIYILFYLVMQDCPV